MADANALTLAEYAIQSNDPLVMAITKSLLFNGNVMADIPFANKKTLVANGVMWKDNLPTVNWNKINGGLTVTKGKPTAYQEQAFFLRNAIDCDFRLLEEENRIVDPRATQLSAYLDAVTYDINNKFINNNHITGDDDSIVGLRWRLDNPSVYNLQSEMKINASALDIRLANATQATANKFVEIIQKGLDFMGRPEGDGVVLYMNDDMKRRFEFLIRLMGTSGGFGIVRDQFDRAITTYKNARIVDVGRTADQSTRIITSTEDSAGADGSSTYSSIYAAVYGEERLIGWQWEPLAAAVQDIGMIGNDGSIARVKIDFGMGLLPQHTRCMARWYGFLMS